jgi:hypothetical protein
MGTLYKSREGCGWHIYDAFLEIIARIAMYGRGNLARDACDARAAGEMTSPLRRGAIIVIIIDRALP